MDVKSKTQLVLLPSVPASPSGEPVASASLVKATPSPREPVLAARLKAIKSYGLFESRWRELSDSIVQLGVARRLGDAATAEKARGAAVAAVPDVVVHARMAAAALANAVELSGGEAPCGLFKTRAQQLMQRPSNEQIRDLAYAKYEARKQADGTGAGRELEDWRAAGQALRKEARHNAVVAAKHEVRGWSELLRPTTRAVLDFCTTARLQGEIAKANAEAPPTTQAARQPVHTRVADWLGTERGIRAIANTGMASSVVSVGGALGAGTGTTTVETGVKLMLGGLAGAFAAVGVGVFFSGRAADRQRGHVAKPAQPSLLGRAKAWLASDAARRARTGVAVFSGGVTVLAAVATLAGSVPLVTGLGVVGVATFIAAALINRKD
jgi:hypothetical protein